MFELNLASLPNHILYLEGVQLSYIKVFVHIFNLWQSDKPCYISNPEFCKRTGLHKDTINNALQFFEKHNIFKRVQKGTRRYLLQTPRVVEIDNDVVDNSPKNSTKNSQESELDLSAVGVRPTKHTELDLHNIKTNTKLNKSFCSSNDKKINNEPKQTAKFWEPGNPDYDRLNA